MRYLTLATLAVVALMTFLLFSVPYATSQEACATPRAAAVAEIQSAGATPISLAGGVLTAYLEASALDVSDVGTLDEILVAKLGTTTFLLGVIKGCSVGTARVNTADFERDISRVSP